MYRASHSIRTSKTWILFCLSFGPFNGYLLFIFFSVRIPSIFLHPILQSVLTRYDVWLNVEMFLDNSDIKNVLYPMRFSKIFSNVTNDLCMISDVFRAIMFLAFLKFLKPEGYKHIFVIFQITRAQFVRIGLIYFSVECIQWENKN